MPLQVRKHLINDKHKALVRVGFLESGKHLFQLIIVGNGAVIIIDAIINTPFFKILINLIGNHVPQ